MKSLVVHYRNKYPKGRVEASEAHLSVYDSKGELRVAMQKDGHGRLICVSEEMGALDRHDLSPIPKDARVYKLHNREGQQPAIGLSEEAEERKAKRDEYLDADGEKILSMADMDPEVKKKRGMSVSEYKSFEKDWKRPAKKDA